MQWIERASCANLDVNMFYPDDSGKYQDLELAMRVCAGCVVKDECLKLGMEVSEEAGIWGGRTAYERIAMRPKRKAA
jgi:WhiB family redox-sensing transcriptional regulator